MLLPSEEDDEAPSTPKKPITPIVKDVSWLIPATFKFQLDNLDIHHKPLTDSPIIHESTEVAEIIFIHSTGASLIMRPDTPIAAATTTPPFTCTSKCLAQLQIILKHQPHVDQMHGDFHN